MLVNLLSSRIQVLSNGSTFAFDGQDLIGVAQVTFPAPRQTTPTAFVVRLYLTGEAGRTVVESKLNLAQDGKANPWFDIDLSAVENQPDWPPSAKGVLQAVADITPLIRYTPSSSGGQVDTIVPGDAIDVDSTDPVNPIVNVKVDGVTVTINGSNELEAAAGAGITDLTGDVTATGPGSVVATIAADAVTNAKLANVAAATFKGSPVGAGTVNPIDLTANQASTILDTATDPFARTSAIPAAGITAVSVASANGLAGSSSGGATPALTLSTTVTGILQGNGTAISAASTTGSGSVVLATSPTLVTPDIGTPSAGVATNITGLPLAGLTGGADDDVAQRKAGAWTSRTLAQYLTDQTPGIRNLFASTVLTYTGGNQNTTSASLANVHSSAAFTISNAGEYEFEFYVTYDSGATSTGIQLSVSGTTTFSYLNTLVSYSVLSTDRSTTQFDAYDGGRPASSSATTTANGAIVKGSIIATAGGSLNLRFASEGAGLSVTITNVIGRLKRTA